MSKKVKKGKTMALTDFLAAEPKLVTVRESTWAAIVDEDEAQKKPLVVDMSGLPTAPRSAVDIDYSTLPNNPPFIAHVANLSFEIDDESLRRIFVDLNPKTARIMRDGNRSRGIGSVEFETRDNLIEGLKRTDKEIYGRKIRISVSDKTDFHQTDSNRGNYGNRSNRTGEERPEMADRWQRVERKSNDFADDRQGSNRDRNNQGRSNFTSGSRDSPRSSDYGYGYPRTRDDRLSGGDSRDHDRTGPRRHYNDDNNRPSSGLDRPRYSDTRDTHHETASNDDNREPTKERPRLQLQPRTKPVQELERLSSSSSSVNNVAATSSLSNIEDSPSMSDHFTSNHDEYQRQHSHDTSDAGSSVEQSIVKPVAPSRGAGASIFGGAKPVDTTARELEIEKKLKELRVASGETSEEYNDKTSSSRPSYNRTNERDSYRDRRDDGRSGHGADYHHRREHSGGRRYEDENRKSHDNDHYGRDRDRYNNSSRRDHDTGHTGRYNHHGHSDRDNNDRNNYRHRETNDSNTYRRSSDDHFNAQPRSGLLRRTVPTEDDSNKLQLSNKFVMLNEDNGVQSPTIVD